MHTGTLTYQSSMALCTWQGAEVIVLGANASIAGVMQAAIDEDADAIVLGVYNGNALALGEQLTSLSRRYGWDGMIVMGGILNQDAGANLPIDARPGLQRLGIRCAERVEDLFDLLLNARG